MAPHTESRASSVATSTGQQPRDMESDMKRALSILTSRETARDPARLASALRRLAKNFGVTTDPSAAEGSARRTGVPIRLAADFADCLVAAIECAEGPRDDEDAGRWDDVVSWLVKCIAIATKYPPVLQTSADSARYIDGYVALVQTIAELTCAAIPDVASAALDGLTEVVGRLPRSNGGGPLAAVIQRSAAPSLVSASFGSAPRSRGYVLRAFRLLLDLSEDPACMDELSRCGCVTAVLDSIVAGAEGPSAGTALVTDPCLAPGLELLWTLCGESPIAVAEMAGARQVHAVRDIVRALLECGHRAVDKDTRDDAMLLTLILSRQPSSGPAFRESGFLDMLVDVAVAHERDAEGSWPDGERPPHVRPFNLTNSAADLSLKLHACDAILALIRRPRAGDAEDGAHEEAEFDDPGDGAGTTAAAAAAAAAAAGGGSGLETELAGQDLVASLARNDEENGRPRAPRSQWIDRGCIDAVANTELYPLMLAHLSRDGAPASGGPSRAWSPSQLAAVRVRALRFASVCALRHADLFDSLGGAALVAGFWLGGAGDADADVLFACFDALEVCAAGSDALRTELCELRAVEAAAETAARGPGSLSPATHVACLRFIASLVDGSSLNADTLAAAGGIGDLCRAVAVGTRAADSDSLASTGASIAALQAACAWSPRCAKRAVVDGDIVDALLDIIEDGPRVPRCSALGLLAGLVGGTGFRGSGAIAGLYAADEESGPLAAADPSSLSLPQNLRGSGSSHTIGLGSTGGAGGAGDDTIAECDDYDEEDDEADDASAVRVEIATSGSALFTKGIPSHHGQNHSRSRNHHRSHRRSSVGGGFDSDPSEGDSGSTNTATLIRAYADVAELARTDVDAWRSQRTGLTARQVMLALWRDEEALVGVDVTEFDSTAEPPASARAALTARTAVTSAAAGGAGSVVSGAAGPAFNPLEAKAREEIAFGAGVAGAVADLDLRPRYFAVLRPCGIDKDLRRGVLDLADSVTLPRVRHFPRLYEREEMARAENELRDAGVRPTTPDRAAFREAWDALDVVAEHVKSECDAARTARDGDARDEEARFLREITRRAADEAAHAEAERRARDPLERLAQKRREGAGLAAAAGGPRIAVAAPSNSSDNVGGGGGGGIGGSGGIGGGGGIGGSGGGGGGGITRGGSFSQLRRTGQQNMWQQQPGEGSGKSKGIRKSPSKSSTVSQLLGQPAYPTLQSAAPPRYGAVGVVGEEDVPVATAEAALVEHASANSADALGGMGGSGMIGAGGFGPGGGAAGGGLMKRGGGGSAADLAMGFRFSSLPAAVNPARQRKKMSRAEREAQDQLLNSLGTEYLDEVF